MDFEGEQNIVKEVKKYISDNFSLSQLSDEELEEKVEEEEENEEKDACND